MSNGSLAFWPNEGRGHGARGQDTSLASESFA